MTVAEAASLSSFAASICWIVRNVVKDTSSNTIMNCVMFVTVLPAAPH